MSISILNQNLYEYLSNGFKEVDGWCETTLFHTVDMLSRAEINQKGGCCEIGVHYGKLFILLNSVIDQSETSYAIDVFSRQDLNIDKSGWGSKEVFMDNLSKYDVHKGKNVQIIEGDSTDYSLELTNLIKPGSIRFMSVDGGHTAEHVINDLNIATQIINNEGVVIVDDILNPYWMGVIEGVVRFLDRKPTLVPFALGHNKLYMAKLSHAEYYKALFSTSPLFAKHTGFFGHTISLI